MSLSQLAGPEKILVAWSGGKDSALALHEVRKDRSLSVASLFTTFNAAQDRVSMHGVRRVLLEAQAKALGIPLREVFIGSATPGGLPASGFTSFPSNEDYEKNLKEALLDFHSRGILRVVFGDIFLEDLKAYRDRLLAEGGMAGIYPLWKRDSRKLLEEFLALGFRAIVVCSNAKLLDERWAGRMV